MSSKASGSSHASHTERVLAANWGAIATRVAGPSVVRRGVDRGPIATSIVSFLCPKARHFSFQGYPATPDFSESVLAGLIVDREDGVVRQLSAPRVAKVGANAVVSDNPLSRKIRISSRLI